MSIRMKLEGTKKMQRQLARLKGTAFDAARTVVIRSALAIHGDAVKSIQMGPKTGRLYRKSNGVFHRASAPGEAPATDEGTLASSIKWIDDGKLTAAVGTNVKYGPYLEFGTRKIQARPWLTPAVEKETADFLKNMTEVLRGKIRASVKKG